MRGGINKVAPHPEIKHLLLTIYKSAMFGIEYQNQYPLAEGENPGDGRRRARPQGRRRKFKKKKFVSDESTVSLLSSLLQLQDFLTTTSSTTFFTSTCCLQYINQQCLGLNILV